jgi:hypothetical protein
LTQSFLNFINSHRITVSAKDSQNNLQGDQAEKVNVVLNSKLTKASKQKLSKTSYQDNSEKFDC